MTLPLPSCPGPGRSADVVVLFPPCFSFLGFSPWFCKQFLVPGKREMRTALPMFETGFTRLESKKALLCWNSLTLHVRGFIPYGSTRLVAQVSLDEIS